MSSNVIEHKGVITNIEENSVFVTITNASACSTCHAKNACIVSDTSTKIIEIQQVNNDFNIGDTVNVTLDQSSGLRSVFFAYVLPLIIILLTLFFIFFLSKNEVLAGIISLLTLVPYYWFLYINKEKFKKTFNFKVNKLI